MSEAPSLLHICAECWKRPALLRRELLWRWSFGLPACVLLFYAARRILAAASLGGAGDLSLGDPMQTAQQLTVTAAALADPVEQAALWLVPPLALAWAVISGFGRSAVLRRIDPALQPAAGSLVLLHLLRITALIAAVLGWYRALLWAAGRTLSGMEPNLLAYSAWVICLSLGGFVLWALVSWVFSIAPLLSALEGKGILPSLAGSLRLGAFAGKLVEVNLVLGIVRLALIVLAMVFSAIPLPFEAEMSGSALYLWWALVTILYLVAGDFFQVVRLAAFVRLWQASRRQT